MNRLIYLLDILSLVVLGIAIVIFIGIKDLRREVVELREYKTTVEEAKYCPYCGQLLEEE